MIKIRRLAALGLLVSGSLIMHFAQGAEGTLFEQHSVTDDSGRKVTYHISRPKSATAPILLMIQGSDCSPVFDKQPGGVYTNIFNLMPFAQEGHFTVVAVEKPYSGRTSSPNPAAPNGCSLEFNQDFTAESWLRALQAALNDARKSPWVDARRTLILGGSEGAVMASLLAGRDERITDVIAIGGSGTTQLYDFIANAYRSCFDVSPCLAEVEKIARAIVKNPDSATSFAWGHPYKRWTSFFRVEPGDEFMRSKARVYLAFGTADKAVPALSQEIIVAKLLAAGRAVTVRRVPNAEHSLLQPGATNVYDLDKETRDALAWFWQVP